ncbi:MAG: 2-oxoglutarate dehydrogenase, protein, partial [Planctomycetota bacterium]
MSQSIGPSLANPELFDEQYARWKSDPAAVTADWAAFFTGFELGYGRTGAAAPAADGGKPGRGDQQKVDGLIYAYRDMGHAVCTLDPLGFNNLASHPQLELATYGLTEADLDREFAADNIFGLGQR